MKIPFLIPVLMLTGTLHAQYYYNDIVSTQETNRQMQIWQTNKIKTITATGYDANGTRATDFAEVKEIRDNGMTLKVSTRNGSYLNSYFNRYDEKGRLIAVTDSSLSTIQSSTSYTYDPTGRITEIRTQLSDPGAGFEKTESHQWFYNRNGVPEKMWRIINNHDSLEIRFEIDEKGNPGDEVIYKWGEESSRIYYYFDDNGRVTDIVRFNNKVKKLLPDMILTYDDKGMLIQKITTSGDDNLGKVTWVGYNIWRYIYNSNQLKTKEALFDNQQKLTGKIEYTYTYF